MKLALIPLEHWEQQNEQLKSHFALPPDNSLRTYKGMAHAAFEIIQGTAQFFSHKRSLGVVRGQTPYFEPLLASFYKETYGIQSISHLELGRDPSSEKLAAWVESLKSDTNFVLFTEDHPVTGELFPWQKLDELLNEKKIFSIRLSHFHHFYEPSVLKPFSVQLCALTPDLAVAKCGARFKVPPLLAPSMNWNVEQTLKSVENIHISAQDEAAVKHFESSMTSQATPWFQANTPRLYERVVLKFNDLSGEALLQALQQKLQLDPSQYFQTLDTTNLCRWNHYRTFSSWWEPKPSEADLEGLLIIDSGWLVTADFAKILTQVCEEIRAQQSW